MDPVLITRAKVRGALEGLTISEVVEKALDVYAPRIEKDANKQINLKFVTDPVFSSLTTNKGTRAKNIALKHTKHPGVPR